MNFFYYPHYDTGKQLSRPVPQAHCLTEIFDLAEQTKETATIGEMLTIGEGVAVAPDFKGPVFVSTGNNDL